MRADERHVCMYEWLPPTTYCRSHAALAEARGPSAEVLCFAHPLRLPESVGVAARGSCGSWGPAEAFPFCELTPKPYWVRRSDAEARALIYAPSLPEKGTTQKGPKNRRS